MNLTFLKRIPLEALIWIAGLVFLFFADPDSENHFTICPFSLLGIESCPGCGLGRSITHLFAGDFQHSFQTHPLGAFAVIVLISRIFILLKHNFTYGKNY